MALRKVQELLQRHASHHPNCRIVDLKAHLRRHDPSKESPGHTCISTPHLNADHRPTLPLPKNRGGRLALSSDPKQSFKSALKRLRHAITERGQPGLLAKLSSIQSGHPPDSSLRGKLQPKVGIKPSGELPPENKSSVGEKHNTTPSKVNEELEYRLLQYEGHDSKLLSAVRSLRELVGSKDLNFKADGDTKAHQTPDTNTDSYIGPSYISFLLHRSKNLSGESDCIDSDIIAKAKSHIENGSLSELLNSQDFGGYKASSRTLITDKSLDSDINNLLESIHSRRGSAASDAHRVDNFVNTTGTSIDGPMSTSSFVKSFNSSCHASVLDNLSQFDYSQVTLQGGDNKPSSSSSVTVPQLSCASIASFLNVEEDKVRFNILYVVLHYVQLCELAKELECNPERLTTEEAAFIIDELRLPYRAEFRETTGGVTISRVKQVLVKRPLVVTIMGHVDHGKTTLLDALQRSDIASGEAGRITQKLGAFSIELGRGKLAFVDTPGHAAFGRMRDRGVQCADVVILVVAADDGVMPQTLEAIELIKREKLPYIVAVNKTDIDAGSHVRGMLEKSGLDLTSVPMVYISAKFGRNIDLLTTALFELGDRLNLDVDIAVPGTAYVFETELHPTWGSCLRAIVRSGVISEGDWLVCGDSYGKLRRMFDSNGRPIKRALPSEIVQLSWSHGRLCAGVFVQQCDSQVKANKLASLVKRRSANSRGVTPLSSGRVSSTYEEPGDSLSKENSLLDEKHKTATPSSPVHIPEVAVVVRCGDQGGLEAVTEWIASFNQRQRAHCDVGYLVERGYIDGGIADARALLSAWEPIRVVSGNVGPFNRSDSQFVETGNVVFLGFSTVLPEGVPRPDLVSIHSVIYELFGDIERIFDFYFGATHLVKQEATMHVTQLGSINVKGVGKLQAIGTSVVSGTVRIGNVCMLLREGKVLARDLHIHSMQSARKNATELAKGDSNNCILFRDCPIEVRIGDELVSYTKEPLPPLFGVVSDCILS
ncbi:translation initiation factor IF-2, putative [Babesia caballi]|uniref:Translation initiation factor IF-2, putative n=1 Tax=Babesia caballi TaxID=5871 RepID=A0AAV4LXW1_BABCB|nr:translation initiation factor IF-2, putative [Babesia caballi]